MAILSVQIVEKKSLLRKQSVVRLVIDLPVIVVLLLSRDIRFVRNVLNKLTIRGERNEHVSFF